MSSTNETNHIEQHQTSKCRRRLDASVCNNSKVGMIKNVDVSLKN